MIIVKSKDEINRIADACRIVAEALDALRVIVAEGITTKDIERFAEDLIVKKGGVAAFKGYRGYPAAVCTSLNSGVVHGIPSQAVRLREGDIISIDLGVVLKGYYGDAAITLPIGRTSEDAQRLIRVTEESLYKGIGMARAGQRVSDISHAIQSHVEAGGYSVVRQFVGHGIGKLLHEEPQIPNYGAPGRGPRLREAMTLAIEPMVNEGAAEVDILDDGWTAITKDRSLSAHFEHTVAVTDGEARILTKL